MTAEIVDFAAAKASKVSRPDDPALAEWRGAPPKPLPPPDLSHRDWPVHVAVAKMFDLDPRYSLEAQGMITHRPVPGPNGTTRWVRVRDHALASE